MLEQHSIDQFLDDIALIGIKPGDRFKAQAEFVIRPALLFIKEQHSSRSNSTESQTMNRGSNVQAGGTAAFVATGDGTAGSGNVAIAGSNVSANDVLLAGKNQVNIVNTTDTDSTRSSNSSKSASAGLSFGTQGWGVSAAMSNAHGDANSDAAIQNASHVTGSNSVMVVSGGDTNITGWQVSGKQITADVGGNLNIASVQDTTTSAAHQSSAGAGFSISQAGGGASVTAQYGHADGDYAGVKEQAGLYAGDGGFDVNVKGNTALTGAVVSSTADAAKNSLTTGTLTFSDVENHSHYSANSIGGSAGLSGQATSDKAVGPASVPGAGGLVPMIGQNESGDQSATTRSAVSAGTINVTDTTHQTQDLANLSRDTTNTNGTVEKTPDVNNILNQQADTMQAAQAAGQVVAQGIGAFADMKEKNAQDAAQKAFDAGDVDAMKGGLADYENWKEGGTDRIIAHIAGGALIGGLGGGTAISTIGGAAGAGVSAYLAPKLNDLSGEIGGVAGNVTANMLAGLAGAAVGGSAGAAAASNADLYNRQLHSDERQWAKDNAGKFAQIYQDQTGQTITADQAQQMLLASGYRMVDAAASSGPAPDGNKYATAFISQYGGDMFRATSAEYNSPFLYGNADHSLTPEQKALPGHDAHQQVGIAAGGALAMVAAGSVAPVIATGWAINSLYDYGGDSIAYLTGLSKDATDASKSLTVGFVAGLAGPAALPLNTLGNGIGAKAAVATYNAALNGAAAFGGNAVANPSSDPSANAATGAASYGIGTAAQTFMPGWVGNIANHIIQTLSGPAQTAVQNAGKK